MNWICKKCYNIMYAGTLGLYVEHNDKKSALVTNMIRRLVWGSVAALLGLMLFAAGCGRCEPVKAPPAGPATKPAPAAAAKAPPPVGVPVLMYHQISDEKGNDAVISQERFKEHMEYLHRNGYSPLTLDELDAYLSGRLELPPKPVVLTFDDGYRDTYEIALPVLKSYGFKSTLFIPAAEDDRRLSWQELREMKAAGMEVASHSYSHRELAAMSPAEQLAEIVKSKEILDRNLGQDTKYFCYPNGSFSDTTLKALKDKGFRLAVTIDAGWVKRGDNPLTLKRVWMGNAVDVRHLEQRLTKEDYPII